jgi:predicted  nucleic acid-binding Zn-ribbon protein
VNEQLRLLVELQHLDTFIISIRKEINNLPHKNSHKKSDLNAVYSSYETFQKNILSLEKLKRDKERSIEELDMKIKKIKDRASEIKTNKEYQAHIKEIEGMQKELNLAEDELLNIMVLLDEKRKAAEIEKAKVADEEKRFKEIEDKIQIEKNIAEEKLELLMKKRKEITDKIDKDNYKIYMNVLKNCNGQAVVEVLNEICKGCNLHIPPQQYVEIKSNKEITLCPQCRRILYYNKPAEIAVPAE